MWNEKFEVMLRMHLPFLSDDEKLSPEHDLREFGLDSMGVVDLLVSLESEYSVRLTDDLLSMETFATPGALWAALTEIQQSEECRPAVISIGMASDIQS
jgi:acyl carrier protein